MVPQAESGSIPAEGTGDIHAVFSGIFVFGLSVRAAVFDEAEGLCEDAGLSAGGAELAHCDFGAYLSGKVCADFLVRFACFGVCCKYREIMLY